MSNKRLLVCVAWLLLILFSSSYLFAAPDDVDEQSWVLYRTGPLTRSETACALLKTGTLSITNDHVISIGSLENPRPLKEHLAFELLKGVTKGDVSRMQEDTFYGIWFSLAVPDGWLLAYGAGELGAQVYWVSTDKKRHYMISESHVLSFINTPQGPIGLVGSGHPLDDAGAVVMYKRGLFGHWKEHVLCSLDSQPVFAFSARTSPASLMVSTRKGLHKITYPNKDAILYKYPGVYDPGESLPGATLFPHEVAVTKDGDMLLTMGFLLLRLSSQHSRLQEYWYVPKDCTRFEITGKECKCSP